MSFTEYEYHVHENETVVRVYVQLLCPVQTEVTLNVFTTDNTAVGKN